MRAQSASPSDCAGDYAQDRRAAAARIIKIDEAGARGGEKFSASPQGALSSPMQMGEVSRPKAETEGIFVGSKEPPSPTPDLIRLRHFPRKRGERAPRSIAYQIPLPLPGKPNRAHISSTRFTTISSILISSPHSRLVSGWILLVASRPIFEPSDVSGEAKSR